MKIQSLGTALAENVKDDDTVVMGAALEALVPFAAGYEIIRQRRRGLTLIAPISDMLFDVLIGAGVASRVIASWVGNVSAGSGYNFRRAIEEDVPAPLEMVDHSNLTLATALHAGGLGLPYLPTRSTLGTDLLDANPELKTIRCPFTGEPLVAVAALRPDTSILAVQQADENGNARIKGNSGVSADAARASERVVLLAEEIVSGEQLRSEPSQTTIPGFLVSAVVHLPRACHPAPCYEYYDRDHDFFHAYHEASRTRDGFLAWLEEWVTSARDHEAYLTHLTR